jgi:hypothetical protein
VHDKKRKEFRENSGKNYHGSSISEALKLNDMVKWAAFLVQAFDWRMVMFSPSTSKQMPQQYLIHFLLHPFQFINHPIINTIV